jgi:hypothetical protein
MTATPGRPAKPDGKKRKQLHLSLYTEDIERLDQLTDNRSEYVRQLIEEAWHKKRMPEVAVQVTLPAGLVRELLQVANDQLSPQEMGVVRRLVQRVVSHS